MWATLALGHRADRRERILLSPVQPLNVQIVHRVGEHPNHGRVSPHSSITY